MEQFLAVTFLVATLNRCYPDIKYDPTTATAGKWIIDVSGKYDLC